jgi:hypothetical protein
MNQEISAEYCKNTLNHKEDAMLQSEVLALDIDPIAEPIDHKSPD